MTTNGPLLTDAAIKDLAALACDPDFQSDPRGVIRAWVRVTLGDVSPDDRWRPTEGNRLTDYIARDSARSGA